MRTIISCVLTSHCKPRWCKEAVESVLSQTHADLQLIVMDSGRLLAEGYFDQWAADPRVHLEATGETAKQRAWLSIQSWAINECHRRGLVRGDVVCYLSDDDAYYPNAFAAVAAAAEDASQDAWYGAVDVTTDAGDGERTLGQISGDVPAGKGGAYMDCYADGMQLFHRRTLLSRFPDDSYWPEGKAYAWHADGVFMDRIGALVVVNPLCVTIGKHRHTPDSAFTTAAMIEQKIAEAKKEK